MATPHNHGNQQRDAWYRVMRVPHGPKNVVHRDAGPKNYQKTLQWRKGVFHRLDWNRRHGWHLIGQQERFLTSVQLSFLRRILKAAARRGAVERCFRLARVSIAQKCWLLSVAPSRPPCELPRPFDMPRQTLPARARCQPSPTVNPSLRSTSIRSDMPFLRLHWDHPLAPSWLGAARR